MWYSPLELTLGLLLLFVVPGFFTVRALFPEWRLSGADALTKWVETGALALVLSTAYTVLVGSILLNLSGTGFSAAWSDPILEAVLGAISIVAAIIALARGGFSASPPSAPTSEPTGGEGGGWDRMRQSEDLARRERRIRHALRTTHDPTESERLRGELETLGRERETLRHGREAEYSI